MIRIRMMDRIMGMEMFLFRLDFLLRKFILSFRTKMEDLKLIQKLRQRKNGVTAEELALGKQATSRKIDVCTISMSSILTIDSLSF